MQFTAIIPARYASTRFPGKPLAMIGSKPMIQRVYEQASKAASMVWVATDDDRIFRTVEKFGGHAVMTSPDHQSGTDRCAEAAVKISLETGIETDVILNIQGDEPFVQPEQIEMLKSCFMDPDVEIATLVRKADAGEDIVNPGQVKAVLDLSGNAMYFSRSAIPFFRGAELSEWSARHVYYKHLGLYAYSIRALKSITKLGRSPLEIAESLEQNRWLENGFKIKTAVTDYESISIDTPADLERATKHYGDFY
jgi:3-deoxy-manno-octulosonate cytidylyltransferase (CMP-KDO synthetase)